MHFSYGPGDVIIFMAGALYHSVTPWKPTPQAQGDPCTPGRIGHVFFFPEKSYVALHNKKKGWAKRSGGGSLEMDPSWIKTCPANCPYCKKLVS